MKKLTLTVTNRGVKLHGMLWLNLPLRNSLYPNNMRNIICKDIQNLTKRVRLS